MQKNYIIHLSDLHIRQENLDSIKESRDALICDIKANCMDGTIALIVCSGDLVFSGTKENFDLALENFLEPIIAGLNLKEEQIVYVPGNHEVDIGKVDMDFSDSFTNRILKSGVTADDFKKPNVTDRLATFFEYADLFSNWSIESPVFTKIISIANINYGVTLINTAWNTAGDSTNEAKKIIIPRSAMVTSLNDIQSCDKKILVMHHPIDWFYDDNAAEIEVLLNKYDFVLTGHKHFEHVSFVRGMNGTTIYNFASKVDVNSTENGYTIIKFDDSSEVEVTNRTYVKKRLAFAPNTTVSENGKLTFTIETDSTQQLCCDTILNTKNGFIKELSTLFIVNLLDNSSNKSFDDLFVMPKIEKRSEQAKERYDDPDKKFIFDVSKMLDCSGGDITFWGKKESGKTIFANYVAKYIYENYHSVKKIPIVLDCKMLQGYKSAIEKAVISKTSDLMDESKSISKEKIITLLENGCFVLILDNFDKLASSKALVDTFKTKYPNNKIIYFRTEIPAAFTDEDEATLQERYSGTTHNYFIRSMDKHSIRKLAQNVGEINPNIEDGYIDKIIYSFSVNNMPRTPFAVSLILSICNESSNYLPTNQAKIVEAFMEKLLEKLNPEEMLSKTFNFDNKERFLACFAQLLFSKKSYSVSKDEFLEFTKEYHTKKGYILKDSRFDTLFFDKGILVEYDDLVFFRYECLNDYYLAKYCILNKDFLCSNIISNNSYLDYADVINYYAGMMLDDADLIGKLQDRILPYLSSHSDLGNLFEVDSIKLELGIPEDQVKTTIASTKQLSTEEKDTLTDTPDTSESYAPTKCKANIHYNENMTFALTVELLGRVLKSSEELENVTKQEALQIFISSCLVLWKQFRESVLSFASKINEEILASQKEDSNESLKDSMDKAYSDFCDILKLCVPLAMSSFIFECVGTEKMRLIFNDYYSKQSYSSPEKLLLLMLLCDLKVPGWAAKLQDYIKNTSKKDFLWVIFFKCQYCLQFNYFGAETPKIIEPMAECYIKVNSLNKLAKSKIIGELSQKTRLLDNKKE